MFIILCMELVKLDIDQRVYLKMDIDRALMHRIMTIFLFCLYKLCCYEDGRHYRLDENVTPDLLELFHTQMYRLV